LFEGTGQLGARPIQFFSDIDRQATEPRQNGGAEKKKRENFVFCFVVMVLLSFVL
jgi:hypothetical protein